MFFTSLRPMARRIRADRRGGTCMFTKNMQETQLPPPIRKAAGGGMV